MAHLPSSSSRYQPVPDVEATEVPLRAATLAPSPTNASPTSASSSTAWPRSDRRRRHSSSLTDDGLREDRGGRDSGDEEEALEMDTFLPSDSRDKPAPIDDTATGAPGGTDDLLALVKKAVPETDDPTLPALTLRAVVIGSFFAALGAAVAQLFFFKSNSPGFSAYFVILITLPLGRWMARNVPDKTIRLPWIGDVELNPGDFSIKEHLLIAIIASSGATSAYASDIINIQILFFHTRMGIIPSLTLLLSTQLLGFGFAGLVHRLLVKTPSMVFPWTLVSTSLFHTLHGSQSLDMRRRLRFFTLAFLAVFCYQFLPALMAPTLSSVAVLCLVGGPTSAMRVLGSGYKGLGMLNFSFDWTAAGSSGPLFQPWWAAVNYYSGFILMMWIIMPILYFWVNFWDAQSFPSVLSSALYTATKPREKFDVSSVLTKENTLDWDKWATKGPIRLTPYFALTYGVSFAILTSMLTHVYLWHRGDVQRALRNQVHDDYHNRAMRNYREVPNSWYLITLAGSLGAAMLLVALTPQLQLPVWGLLLAVVIALAFLVPVGIVKAVSDTGVGLNVITEFVAGYLLPGRPIANVCFKCYGYMAMSQALNLVADMKLALYMKIPPRSMFMAQFLGTVIGCVVNYAVLSFVLSDSSGYLPYISGEKEDPTGQWDGRKVGIFYSASIIWGAVGPKLTFSGSYRSLYWGFVVGAVAPVPFYLLHRSPAIREWAKRCGVNLDRVAMPVFLHGMNEAPQTPTNESIICARNHLRTVANLPSLPLPRQQVILSGLAAAYASQKWARTRHPKWFERYNYVLSAALDAGASINALVVFILSVTLLKVIPMPHWWLNPARDSEYCSVPEGVGVVAAAG